MACVTVSSLLYSTLTVTRIFLSVELKRTEWTTIALYKLSLLYGVISLAICSKLHLDTPTGQKINIYAQTLQINLVLAQANTLFFRLTQLLILTMWNSYRGA